MPILQCRRVVFFSHGDEAAFFWFARSIPAIRRIEGKGDAILLHVAARVSGTSLRELRGLFRRFNVDESQLAALDGQQRGGSKGAAESRRRSARPANPPLQRKGATVGLRAPSRARR